MTMNNFENLYDSVRGQYSGFQKKIDIQSPIMGLAQMDICGLPSVPVLPHQRWNQRSCFALNKEKRATKCIGVVLIY